ncbi:Small ubiquitin-like modifier 1, 1,SUMO1,ATSUMO1 [Canna indica]|uniref:Small ubiquitin-like modifier 1, 1,SUMO1,ATSUMO1 n=1 Tax=Canna indica TaxID=4628 RepID=A0AAQ3JT96_9LILI|nr:Small ubiquitin-like modifier 1, 1,SUMO1,ATSUMO1 [Canna indica]
MKMARVRPSSASVRLFYGAELEVSFEQACSLLGSARRDYGPARKLWNLQAESNGRRYGERARSIMAGHNKRIHGFNPQRIHVKVISQDGVHGFIRIKRSSKFERLMAAFCERKNVALNELSFYFNSRKIEAEETPEQLGMEDDAEILAMPYPNGG